MQVGEPPMTAEPDTPTRRRTQGRRRGAGRLCLRLVLVCRVVAVAVCVMIAPGARAGTDDCPHELLAELFDRGEWRTAAGIGEKSTCPAALAIAARALLAEGSFMPPGAARDRLIDRAVAVVERALALDPEHLETRIEAAAAYGFRAARDRSIGDVRCSKRHLKAARRLAPEDPLVLAAWGYWHGRTVLGAGRLVGGLLFGARREAARRAFAKALERADDHLAIVAGYGRLLIRFGASDWRDGIALLERVRSMPPHNALETRLKEQALQLLAAYEKGADGRALRRLADSLAPFAEAGP